MPTESLIEIEEWRPVVGYEGLYSVSNLGRFRKETSSPGYRIGIRNPPLDFYGYKNVCLTKDGKLVKKLLHRLVLEAFIGLDPERPECNHKNGTKGDSALSNLEWVTHTENVHHAIVVLGKTNKGERHGMAKLTDSQVLAIREQFRNGKTQIAISKEVGVARVTITRIVRRANWRHI